MRHIVATPRQPTHKTLWFAALGFLALIVACTIRPSPVEAQAAKHKAAPPARTQAARGPDTTEEDLSDDAGEGVDEVRVENEMKIGVPDSLVEKVWAYLQKRYLPRPTFLEPPGFTFGARASDEFFTDVYYDTGDLWFLRNENGLRHRSRNIPGDTQNRKNGRELMQIKLQRVNDDSTARSEIKFKIKHYTRGTPGYDASPAIGIVKRSDRPAFIARLAELGVNARDLREMITVDQHRRRVYVYDDAGIFLSLTLDNTSSKKWGMSRAFTEIELELNELVYTAADSSKREFLKGLNERIRADLVGQFPTLVQDQTPKYNKMMNAFAQQSSVFPVLLTLRKHSQAVNGFAFLAVGLGIVSTGMARHRRRQSLTRTDWARQW